MGRTPPGLNRGPWTRDEDLRLKNYIEAHGEGGWRTLPVKAGLLRCGKSCRLRWMNYLRPDVKCGHILPEEEDLILRLHRLLGNRWALIAGRIPGRTDNEIKNYWNTHLSKKLISQGIDPRTHKHLSESHDEGSKPGDRGTNQKSQQENNTATLPAGNIADRRDDLQAVPSKGGAIVADGNNDNREVTTAPASNVNQISETSPTCNSQPASVAINESLQTSAISSTPSPFLESTFNNNINMVSGQIPYPSLRPTCFDSLALRENVGRYDLDQYLMENPVTTSNDMITSTLRLSSGIHAAQFEPNHSFISGNDALLYNEKHQTSIQPADIPASSAAPHDKVIAMSYPYYIPPTSMAAAALGDFNSDNFQVLLQSFVNEDLQALQEPGRHTSHEQNLQLCPFSQPEAANLTHNFWSMLSPSSQ